MSFFNKGHGHQQCITNALSRLEDRAQQKGRRLGKNDRIVLDALLHEHRAMGAYEIADEVRELGKKLQPVQIYRALDNLIGLGSVHRVETRNAFIACHSQDECNAPHLLICDECNHVAEFESVEVDEALQRTADRSGFILHHQQVELTGICPDCQS